MFNINDYLKKFKVIVGDKKQAQTVVVTAVKNVVGIEIRRELIEVKDGILYIKENPLIKNSIYINKKVLVENINKAGVKIFDIR